MDLPDASTRRGVLFYLQIAAVVVSLLVGLATITKESAPIVERVKESQRQAELQRQREDALRKATQIAQMDIQWQYRGNDGTWRYYSDPTGRFWFRTNIEGVREYTEHPDYQTRAM
jgi:hypothetical protein